MRSLLSLSLLLLCTFALSPATTSGGFPGDLDDIGDIAEWCNDTSHPKLCEFYLASRKTPDLLLFNPRLDEAAKHKPNFFVQVAIEVALGAASVAKKVISVFGSIADNKRETAAWLDCVDLFSATVSRLDQTLSLFGRDFWDDTQTWLSAALTNLQTCFNGFHDLNVTNHILPMIEKTNVSHLISYALSVNKPGPNDTVPASGWAPAPAPSGAEEGAGRPAAWMERMPSGFPAWARPGNRRLLQGRKRGSTARAGSGTTTLVVAPDKMHGQFQKVSDAVAKAAKLPATTSVVIYVKAGIYYEQVKIPFELKNLKMVGDGIGKTIITGDKSVGGGSTTLSSATFGIMGDGFMASDMTFRNTAGAKGSQAVALRSASDLSVFYRCSFEGYQDTLYSHSGRQFFRECNITGTVDFIFGNAAAVFQKCTMLAHNSITGENVVTAHGRTDPNQNTGFSIIGCKVDAARDLQGSRVKTYLARPWQKYSRMVVMKTFLGRLINKAGWLRWSQNFALDTLYYGEYGNTGPGSPVMGREKWKGVRPNMSYPEASSFTVGKFILGGMWLPAKKVPYYGGLCENNKPYC